MPTRTFHGCLVADFGGMMSVRSSEDAAVVTSPVPASSKNTYKFNLQVDLSGGDVLGNINSDFFDPGVDKWATFYAVVQFRNPAGTPDLEFLQVKSQSGGVALSLVYIGAGDLLLRNDIGNPSQTISGVFELDRDYLVTLKMELTDPGDVRVWVQPLNPIGVNQLQLDINVFKTTAGDLFLRLQGLNAGSPVPPNRVKCYCDGAWIETDDGTLIDDVTPRGYFVCLAYFEKSNTTTSDFGDDPFAGSWANTSDRPNDDTDHVEFTGGESPQEGGVTFNSGAGAGPKGDARTEDGGQMRGAMWATRVKTTNNFGNPIAIFSYGASAVVTTDNTVQAPGITPSVNYQNIRAIGGVGSVNMATEMFQVAIKQQDGIGKPRISQMFAALVYEEPPASTRVDRSVPRGMDRGINKGAT